MNLRWVIVQRNRASDRLSQLKRKERLKKLGVDNINRRDRLGWMVEDIDDWLTDNGKMEMVSPYLRKESKPDYSYRNGVLTFYFY